ncbi:serine carboxypeptidase-like 18 [Olea europaea var. sylvestris]|uniref:serine carboxypeptidase-like 18 n=1 Tax=Olea europaea var. sylvestris TaxID=158386 RepID=UPI000C1CEDAA|nr:serine carboxypeptidase-like 18 [Olea europaea var. sylvestris]
MVALEILRGNEAGLQPRMSLQGYIIGNGITDQNIENNAQIPYAHRMALISNEYFEAAKISCNGEYDNPDPNNLQCLLALQPIHECINPLDDGQILEPKCAKPHLIGRNHTFWDDFSIDHLLLPFVKGGMWCRVSFVQDQNYATSYVWANDPTVQEALHIRKGMILGWTRCNHSLSYEINVQSVVQFHKLLSEKGYQALVYSGDHDMIVSYMSTLKWIRSLNMTVEDNWRPWVVNGQVAGFTEKYKNNDFYLTFVTVKGAGHTATEFKPKECFAMLDRWLSLYPL